PGCTHACSSDDSSLAQALALRLGEAEPGQYVVGVFAQARAALADAPRGAAELGQHAGHLEGAGEGLDLLDHAPRRVVRVLHDVRGGVGIAGRYVGAPEGFQHLLPGVPGGPLADGGVDQLGMLAAAVVVGEARVLGQVGPADQVHQALVDAVAVAGDQHVGAIAAAVGIGRRDAGQGAAGRLAYMAEGIVFRDQAFHHGEHRFVQGHVDDLTLATALALLQGEQDADDAVQGGPRIPDAHADAHRRLPRIAGEVAQTAHGFADHAEAGQVPVGPGLAVT